MGIIYRKFYALQIGNADFYLVIILSRCLAKKKLQHVEGAISEDLRKQIDKLT